MNAQTPTSILFAGVGGSGIVGDILTDYCRYALRLPVMVCRSPKVPEFVDEHTLVIAISYSGETGETLEMFGDAKHRGARLAVVCSGGRLLDAAKTQNVPYVKVPSSTVPRVALPELVGAVMYVLGTVSILKDYRELLVRASAATESIINSANASVPLAQNPAKQAATALMGHLPLIIGGEENVSVLRRFKNELNENSKVPAFFLTLPEAYHDDVEGLKGLSQMSQPQPVILRSQTQTEQERRVEQELGEVLLQLGFPTPFFYGGVGSGRFEWLLSAVTFGDFASVYLSALRGVDPSELSLIPHLRAVRGQV
jgi:glucose/mannose-6-phosphate isomerase